MMLQLLNQQESLNFLNINNMCFTKLRNEKMKKAKKFILVYKGLDTWKNELCSPYHDSFKWKEKKRVEEEEFVKNSSSKYLYKGFHSCKTIEEANGHGAPYEFIIPKGALYYENADEYLSNKIYLRSAKPVKL